MLAQTTSTTTTTIVNSGSSITHLSGVSGRLTLWLTVGLVIAAGIVVAASRYWLEGRNTGDTATLKQRPDRTLIRSWLAISLAGGLLLFSAVSFGIDDSTLRSTLIGGLVANAGAAIAFYFASKSSDQARHDILNASFPSTWVPNLVGKNETEASTLLARTPLRLNAQPERRDPNAIIVDQSPPANQQVPQTSEITATFAGPIPDVTHMTGDQATTALASVNLILLRSGSGDAAATAQHQDPAAGAIPPSDRKVTVTFG